MSQHWEAVTLAGCALNARAEADRVIYAIRTGQHCSVMSHLANGLTVPEAMARDFNLATSPMKVIKIKEASE